MKKRFLSYSIALVLVGWGFVDAKAQQPLKVGANPTNINRTAVLDVEATNKGALLPRVALTSLTDVTTIANPANALTVFNTATDGTAPDNVTPGYYYYSTAINKWVRLLSQGDAISTSVSNTSSTNNLTTTVNGVTGSAVSIINGNTLTAASNTITSTVNGVAAVLTPAAGGTIAENLGFNAAGDLVRQTASSTSQNIYNTDGTLTGARTITMGSNALNFRSNSASAVAYLSYGRTAVEMDMGVAGANDNGFKGVVPGESWLAGTSNLYVGTRGTGSLRLITGPAGNEVTRIFVASGGAVGVGTTSPVERLDVAGNLRFTNALMPGGSAGSVGQVLTSAGAGAPPTWTNATTQNIYNIDGTLTSNRTINMAGRELSFLSNSESSYPIFNFGRIATEMDMGVASANGNGFAGTVPGDSWLGARKNLFVGAQTSTGSFNVVTGGATRIFVANGGAVGVGTSSPTERLDVAGNLRFTGSLMPGGSHGSAGQLLMSNGTNNVPSWTSLNAGNTPNIYTQNGTVTGTRTINTAGNSLNFLSNAAGNVLLLNLGRESVEMDLGVAGGNGSGLDGTTPGDGWVASTSDLFVGTRGTGSFNVVTGTAGSGVTRMTINSAGRVGIGTTSPGQILDVAGTIKGTNLTNGTGAVGSSDFGLYSQTNNWMRYVTAGGNHYFYTDGAGGSGGNNWAGGTPVMVLNANGRLGLGTTTPAVRVHVRDGNLGVTNGGDNTASIGAGNAPNSGVVMLGFGQVAVESADINLVLAKNPGASFDTSLEFIKFRGGTATIGGISSNTNRNGVIYSTTSDMRLKENIVPTHLGLSAVKDIKVYDYNFKTDPDKTQETGVLAQELYKIFPQAVSVGGDDPKKNPWAVDYGKLTPLLVKAIQEQQLQIEALKKEIENLKNK